MPPPEDVTGVRKFLGFVGYYRKFIPRYSDVARPLTNLTRRDTPFQWTTLCQEAFEMLKSFLLKEPVLKYPNPDQPYVLYTDASKYAWAGVLTQAHTHVVDGVEKRNSPPRYLCQWTVSGGHKSTGLLWSKRRMPFTWLPESCITTFPIQTPQFAVTTCCCVGSC